MKKILLLTLSLVVLAFSSGMASEVTKKDAQKVAVNAYFENVNQYDQGISFANVVISNEYTRYLDGTPAFYAFDFATGGFVIVSAEDVFDPIIGYSFEGEFPKGEHAYVYASFLQGYVDQIAYIRENNITAEASITAEWSHLSTSDIANLNILKNPKDVDPLVTAMWNQDNPYNLMCPADGSGPGGHAYVGCVATAMSLIMHYWNYPIHGENERTYTPPNPAYGPQYANFEDTYYSWTGMQDVIDNKNPYPIAEIGYHCAVAVDMDFGPDGSGAYSFIVANRIAYYLRYDAANFYKREDYSVTSWHNFLTNDIDNGYPIYYSGVSSAGGGHAFVCDGYQGTDYHFNFGWSGSGNGYFSINDVGGYHIQQRIVCNFIPTDPAFPYHNTGQIVLTELSGQFADGSGPVEDYLANTEASWLIDPQTDEDSITDITLYFISSELGSGDFLRIYDGGTTSASLLGEYTGSTLPDEFTSTGNQMLITLSTDGSSQGPGFKAEYDANRPAYCGMDIFTDPLGTFDDGSGEFFYNPGNICLYQIQPPYANQITITFNYFDTEEGTDILKVFDGSSLLVTLSGSDLPDPIVVPSGNAVLRWQTSSFVQRPGWEINYEIGNVGVEEPVAFTELEVFPNPATDALNVNFQLDNSQSIEMRLVNVTGEAIYSDKLTNVSGSVNHKIDVSNFAKGIYILNLTSGEGTVNKKIIIK
ncbi:MAG: hypothetical protein DRJ15_07360 [Bacteroidetes bacterium]|nr:MAG: hypothetical protein DRJ15_07360 [Bacteroidota bacterium]